MRLGSYPCVLSKSSRVKKLYGRSKISERHRHRYEVNPQFFEELEKAGLLISGRSPDGKLAEMVECPEHAGGEYHMMRDSGYDTTQSK